ncbi:MAG: TIM barrel protein [Methanocellales archaeon]
MIKVGIAGMPIASKGKGTEEGIRYIARIGLEALEIQFVRNVYMSSEGAKRAGKIAMENKIELTVHAPYYINLSSNKTETVEKSKQWIISSAKVASALNSNLVVFHPGYETGNARELIVKTLNEIIEELHSIGIKNVLLGLETTGKQSQFGSIEEIKEVVEEVEGTKPVLDFAHIHARTNGALKSKKAFELVFDSFNLDSYHIHFTAVEYSGGNEKKHLALNGEPDFKLLAEVLIERGYDATIICESPFLERDALKMKEVLRNAEKMRG